MKRPMLWIVCLVLSCRRARDSPPRRPPAPTSPVRPPSARARRRSETSRLAVPSEHYGRLARLDAKPRPGAGALDRRLFDLGAMSPGYFKILGRAPVYLDDSPIGFSLPEFPANSSAQTRAELDYLLELQAKARSPEAVARSQMLAGVFYRVSTQPGDEDYTRMRRNLFFTGSELGEWFGPETLPKTGGASGPRPVRRDVLHLGVQVPIQPGAAVRDRAPDRAARDAELSGVPERPLREFVDGGLRVPGADARKPRRLRARRGRARVLARDPRRPLPQRLGIGPGTRAAGRRPVARVSRVPQGSRSGARRDCRR